MHRLLAGACLVVFALAAVKPASAGDDFKGFYFGGNLGGVSGKVDANTKTVFSPTGYFATTSPNAIYNAANQKPDSSNVTGGGQVGFNFQHGAFVIGAEADFGSMSLDRTRSATGVYPCCAPTNFTVSQTVSTGWVFTARPRIGFAAGPALFYGTGGVASTNITYKTVFTDTFASATEGATVESTNTGWTAGGGIEIKSGKHWSWKGEYLYADFGTVKATSTNLKAFTPAIAFPTNVFSHTASLVTHTYRVGVNYHF